MIRPYWDFTIYYNDQCIFLNPLFDESSLRGELDCKGVCKELGENIETMEAKGANPSVIFDDYLQANIPLVVNNAFDNWRATDELSIAKLAEVSIDELHGLVGPSNAILFPPGGQRLPNRVARSRY